MKKFLIISSYAPPAISGAQFMMHNLLRYFPAGSFSILTSHSGIDAGAKGSDRWLKANYHFFDSPKVTVTDYRQESSLQKFKTLLKKLGPTKLLGELFFLLYLPFNIVRKGRKIVPDEKIQILLGYSDSGPALISTYFLHKLTGKPFCLFFYDLYAGNRLPFLHRAAAKFFEPLLFRSAARIFVMSEALANHYKTTYGVKTVIINNSIPIPEARPNLSPLTPPFKIIYTGTVYWAQADAVKDLALATEGLPRQDIQLWLYTPHDKNYLNNLGIFDSSKIIFASSLPSQMPQIQSEASILIVALAFKSDQPLLINTSSPAKTYEYLISGRPILVHAPKESYISKYARNRNFAYVVDSPDVELLKQAINALLENKDLAAELTENAWKTANLNHNDKQTGERFKNYFEHD